MIIDTICVGCDLSLPVNDLGLCDKCYEKLERDLIRARDWEHSATAFAIPNNQLEALREEVIRKHGVSYELIADPHARERGKSKDKESHSRSKKMKQKIALVAIRDYDTDTVLQHAQDFIRRQDKEWVNFSRLSQYLHETFYNLKPKHLGSSNKKHKSLLKFLADYPSEFELRPDDDKKGVFWIRLR